MTTLLIAAAIIIAFAALYWLDRREQDSTAADISGYIFPILDAIKWNMSEAELKQNVPAIEDGVSSELNNNLHIYIKDSHANTNVIVYFIVAKGRQDALKILQFIMTGMHEDDVNNLFKRLCSEYGTPDEGDEMDDKGTVTWVNEQEVVMFMNMHDKGHLLSFCEKNHYQESNQGKENLLPFNII